MSHSVESYWKNIRRNNGRRIRISMNVTPIADNAGGVGEISHKAIDTRAARIGNSVVIPWDGNEPQMGTAVNPWPADGEAEAGILQCITSGAAAGNLNLSTSGANGVWVKNTGFKYDASKSGNVDTAEPEDTTIELFAGTSISNSFDFCFLAPGASIFIPRPANAALSINDDEVGNPVAVELVVYT